VSVANGREGALVPQAKAKRYLTTKDTKSTKGHRGADHGKENVFSLLILL